MKKYKYSTTVEVGDLYEFCVEENKTSKVLYGKVISINTKTKTFDFVKCNNSIKNGKFVVKEADKVYKDVSAIRGIGHINEDTWNRIYPGE